MPSEDSKILDFNQFWKFGKASSIIYADLESLIKKIDSCKRIFPVDIQCLQYGH